MDNYRDPGDLMATGIYRTLRWQPDSHLDRGSSDHLDIQLGGWPSRGLSGIYCNLFRHGRLLQLTRDQTYSQLLADTGQIPQHEVSTQHLRHILTDAIGVGACKVNVEVRHLPLLNEDRLLLCTDGLTEIVDVL